MLPDRVSNPGSLAYESGALPIALCGPASIIEIDHDLLASTVDNPPAVAHRISPFNSLTTRDENS